MSNALVARRGVMLAGLLVIGAALASLPLKWLAVAVIGMIAGVVMVIRPALTLIPLAFAIPFGSIYEINLGGITVGITEVLIGLFIVAWLARAVALRETERKTDREADRHWPVICLPLLVFIGTTLFSLINATALPFALKELIKWLEVLGIVLLVANIDRRTRPWVIAALLLAGAAQAALGAYQFLTQSGPKGFVLMGRFMRAYGSFKQPNPFAGYLGLVAPLGFALSITLFKRKTDTSGLPGWLGWLALGSFALTTAGIVMSWSRGAWLAFAAALGTMNMLRSRRGALLFTLLVLLIALAGLLGNLRLLPAAIMQRLTGFVPFATVQDVRAAEITDENYAVLERLAHWQSALDMWRDHPWIGVGFGNYEAAYPAYALPKWPMALGHAHNYYLNIAAETGLLGLTGYVALWGLVGRHLVQAIRRAPDVSSKALALGALGMLIHVSVHNLLDNLWVHNIYIHVAMVLGLVCRPQIRDS